MKKRPSLEELAKMLGVSKSLVSFVINNKAEKYGISPETKKRVLDTIQQLGFQPNSFARSLRTGRSHSIGLIIPDISNPFYSAIASKIESLAYEAGYRVFISNTKEVKEREDDLLSTFINGNTADGIILASCAADAESIQKIVPKKYPLVLLDRVLNDLEIPSVSIENFESTMEMTQHLISQGCKKIGLLAISPIHISSIKARVDGYKKALQKNKLAIKDNLIKQIPFHLQREKTREEIKDLVENEKVDAVLVLNNCLAKYCVEVFDDLNVPVPSKLKFASFDDSELFIYMKPAVSVIAQPIEELAEQAFKKLWDAIRRRNNEEVPDDEEKQVVLKPNLIFRNSTK